MHIKIHLQLHRYGASDVKKKKKNQYFTHRYYTRRLWKTSTARSRSESIFTGGKQSINPVLPKFTRPVWHPDGFRANFEMDADDNSRYLSKCGVKTDWRIKQSTKKKTFIQIETLMGHWTSAAGNAVRWTAQENARRRRGAGTRARVVVVGTRAHLFGKSMIAGRRTGVRVVFLRVSVVSGATRPPARNRRETRRPGGDFSAKKCTAYYWPPPPTLRGPASVCLPFGGRRRPYGGQHVK